MRRLGQTAHAVGYLRPLFDATILAAELTGRLGTRAAQQTRRALHVVSNTVGTGSILVEAGEREVALRFLRDWFEHHTHEYLKICDPFFGPEDLEVLRLLRSVNPDCQVQILTSKARQDREGDEAGWKRRYQEYWRVHVSEQSPPATFIAIVGVPPGGELPIHDRWWLTKGAGLRVGTSFNGLGVKRDSEISPLSEEEAQRREAQVNQYLFSMGVSGQGERLYWHGFTLE